VLDDVERRRFPVQPAGEDPPPTIVRLPDVELDEGAGQRFFIPWRARFAGPEPDDRVLDPHRLARPQGQVADNAVALVEQANDGDPLGHGRHAFLAGDDRAGHIDGDRLAFLRFIGAVAAGEQGQCEQGGRSGAHVYSGIQGW